MPFRVHDILLVSSLYDSFILREDGRLNELLIGESLRTGPAADSGITHVSSGAEALARARSEPRFNLIVANLQLGDMNAAQLARRGEEVPGCDVPVVVLAYDYREVKNFGARNPVTDIERIFCGRETSHPDRDCEVHRGQAERSTIRQKMGVPVMLVVEDNIRYYSSFLPLIYTELITQSRG